MQRPQWQGGSAACYWNITGKRLTQLILTLDGGLQVGFEYTVLPEEDDSAEEAGQRPYPTARLTPALELKGTEWLKNDV